MENTTIYTRNNVKYNTLIELTGYLLARSEYPSYLQFQFVEECSFDHSLPHPYS